MIQFPFWLLTPAGTKGDPAESRHPVAFSSVERMGEYLKAQTSGEWGVQLVNRYSVAEVLSHLNDSGQRSLRHDVHRDGSGGTEVSIEQITAAARQAQ